MSKPKIFVVQPIMEKGRAELETFADVEVFESERMISKDELLAGVKRSDYLFALGDTPIDREVIEANPNLKGIGAMTLFPNVIDVDAATENGVPLTVVDHTIDRTTCDLTMALIVGLAWRIVEADRFTRCGKFHQEQSMSLLTTELTGKTLGMIGLGRIGEHIVKRARAFEMDVIYTKRNRLETSRESELEVEWGTDQDTLLETSDFVCLMANYNPTTHKLMGAREFELMKPSAFFINTARGRMVDEEAMVAALQNGTIAGAGLDVYWNEPPISEPAPDPALYQLNNVILTPHIGSATREARDIMTLSVAANLRALVDGERPPNLYNPEVYGDDPLPKSDRIG